MSTGNAVTGNAVAAAASCNAVIPGTIHVSCYITAANRAAPVFEVVPQRNAVRCVTKPARDASCSMNGMSESASNVPANYSAASSSGLLPSWPPSSSSHSAEWSFDTVFRPSRTSTSPALQSHPNDFFHEISIPALNNACQGVNTNIVAWGVHPTQKLRLLFGKSTGNMSSKTVPSTELSENDAMELYGQVGATLHHFFSRFVALDWRLGISSWIVVNNQAVDLLKPPPSSSSSSSRPAMHLAKNSIVNDTTIPPLSFVSIEASSLSVACRILQMAKTNRIVLKQNTESAHFFVRLALYHRGQVSTLHFVDLIDLRDFEPSVAACEKSELLEILQGLRQPPSSTRLQRISSNSPPTSPSSTRGNRPRTPPRSPSVPATARSESRSTTLANFMMPLLTANAQTYFYANVIDSRSTLRESVALLNAVANLKDYACPCRRLSGVRFGQLGFQAPPTDFESDSSSSSTATFETQSAVSAGETLLNQFAAPSPVLPSITDTASARSRPSSARSSNESESSDTMRWLDAFQQRKRDILGAHVDTISPGAEVVALANSRIESIKSRSVDISERHQQSPTSTSVGEIYEHLRRSMLENEVAGNPGDSGFKRHNSISGAIQSPQTEEMPGDANLDELAEATMTQLPTRPGSQTQRRDKNCSSGNSNSQCECDYISSKATAPSAKMDSISLGTHLGEWDRVVLPQSVESKKPSPEQKANTEIAFSAHQESLTRQLRGISFESQCALAGVPSSSTLPPNIDGLDPATSDKVCAADAALLRKNYDALLTIVREQQNLREEAEARAVEACHDQEELQASFELHIEDLKLENVALRRKIRVLEKRSGAHDALEQCDRDIQVLQLQVKQLQERNVALEIKLAYSNSGNTSSGIELKKKYQQVVDQKLQLEQELAEYRKRERHLQVYSKLVDDSTRRVDQLSRDLSEKEQALAATKLGKLKLNAEMNQAVEKAELLHEENEKLLIEKAATNEELVATKMYLASIEAEKKKAEVLDKFVKKHGFRMRELRQDQSVPSGGGYATTSAYQSQPWKRTGETRECEERLFAAVKRSLPNTVPLVNKLLRRLEVQELSLQEFSEREVDFINLLVELASDQPAVALKRMIEDEMKKLQVC